MFKLKDSSTFFLQQSGIVGLIFCDQTDENAYIILISEFRLQVENKNLIMLNWYLIHYKNKKGFTEFSLIQDLKLKAIIVNRTHYRSNVEQN